MMVSVLRSMAMFARPRGCTSPFAAIGEAMAPRLTRPMPVPRESAAEVGPTPRGWYFRSQGGHVRAGSPRRADPESGGSTRPRARTRPAHAPASAAPGPAAETAHEQPDWAGAVLRGRDVEVPPAS